MTQLKLESLTSEMNPEFIAKKDGKMYIGYGKEAYTVIEHSFCYEINK